MTASLILVIAFGLVVIIMQKRANHSRVIPITCEEYPCLKHRKQGTLWCKNHQPRKPELKTLEERLL